MFIDTHCHLSMIRNLDIETVVEQAREVGVQKIVTVATTLADTNDAIHIAHMFDGVYATAGIHPCDATEQWRKKFEEIEKLVSQYKKNKIVAIGETGLDFYHKPFFKDRQQKVFEAHIGLAIEYDLPLVIHIRESANAVLDALERYRGRIRGVAHCFSQDEHIAKRLLNLGFYFGIGGPVTYPKNERLRTVIKQFPKELLLLETDAPFLPPQPFRGKTNYPKYIPLIAEKVAQVAEITIEELESITTQGAQTLFRL